MCDGRRQGISICDLNMLPKVGNNQLQALPVELCRLTKLKELHVRRRAKFQIAVLTQQRAA
jgi:hypothetical protein